MREAFARWADPALTLTVGGVGITIPAPTIRVGLQLKAMYADLLAGETADIPNLHKLLPDTAAVANLTDGEREHLARTAAAWFGAGPDLAEHVWRSLDPDQEPAEPVEEEPTEILGRWGWYDPRPGAYGPDDPGGGDWNPHTGYRLWVNEPAAEKGAPTLTWPELLDAWNHVVCDFQQHYHLDLDTLVDSRSIAWLELRLAGLQEITDSRIRILTNAKEAPRAQPAP